MRLCDTPSNRTSARDWNNNISIIGPRFGVEPAENGTYRAAVYLAEGMRMSDRRQSYGEAFIHASEMASMYGAHNPREA